MSVETFTEEMIAYHAGRRPSGLRRKYKRMYKEGPFVFFRGTNYLFAKMWPDLKPRSPVCPVHSVWTLARWSSIRRSKSNRRRPRRVS